MQGTTWQHAQYSTESGQLTSKLMRDLVSDSILGIGLSLWLFHTILIHCIDPHELVYEYVEALDDTCSVFWAGRDPQSTCSIRKLVTVMLVVYFEVVFTKFREFVMFLIGIFWSPVVEFCYCFFEGGVQVWSWNRAAFFFNALNPPSAIHVLLFLNTLSFFRSIQTTAPQTPCGYETLWTWLWPCITLHPSASQN